MFGFTKLSPEEKAEHERKKRIFEVEKLLSEETELRQVSLLKSKELQNELESLSKK